MKPGRFEEHPMPETMTRSLGATPRRPAAIFTAFKTPKSPQPGHQSGSTGPAYVSRGSSITVAMRDLPSCIHGLPVVGGSGFDANGQLPGLGAGVAGDDVQHPPRLAVAVRLYAPDTSGPRRFAEVRPDVMVRHFAAFRLRDVQRSRSSLGDGKRLLGDVVRLERLTVVFQYRIVNRIPGFGPQVPRELGSVIHFNADGALAAPQDLERLFRVERMDVFEVQPIDANPFSGQLLRRFLNDAFRGTASDQSHVRVLRTFELGRRQFGQNQGHLLHALLLDLAADGRRSKDVADENSLFVMVVR